MNSTLKINHNLQRQISPRTISFMGLFIFLMSVGEGMVAPAIPLYGDALGASYKQLGFLMTGYSIAYTLMTVTAGRISDKIGRKGILLLSIVLSIIASGGYYLSTTPFALLCFRTLEGMSRGILWPIAEAIVADNTVYEDRSKVMGRFSAAYGLGATIGTLSGGYVMQYINITAVFPIYPVLGLIVFGTSLYGITDTSKKHSSHHGIPDSLHGSNVFNEIKNIWPVCFAGFAYAGFIYSIWGFLSKIADFVGVSPEGIGVIFAYFWGARMISFLVCGEMAAKLGPKKILLTGIAFCILSTVTFFIINNFWLLVFAAVTGGIGTGIMFPMTATLIADFINPSYLGFGMGFLEFCMGIGMILQTALSGLVGELAGINFTYLFIFIVAIIAFVTSSVFIQEGDKKQ